LRLTEKAIKYRVFLIANIFLIGRKKERPESRTAREKIKIAANWKMSG
jgi:hypothetical protein